MSQPSAKDVVIKGADSVTITITAGGNVNLNATGGGADSNSTITAGNKASIKSGGDTNIIGGAVNAKTVVADIGGDLFITSPQSTSAYTESSSSSGFSMKLCPPVICYGTSSFSVSAGKNNVDSNYKSTGDASGIHADDGGFQVSCPLARQASSSQFPPRFSQGPRHLMALASPRQHFVAAELPSV